MKHLKILYVCSIVIVLFSCSSRLIPLSEQLRSLNQTAYSNEAVENIVIHKTEAISIWRRIVLYTFNLDGDPVMAYAIVDSNNEMLSGGQHTIINPELTYDMSSDEGKTILYGYTNRQGTIQMLLSDGSTVVADGKDTMFFAYIPDHSTVVSYTITLSK